VSGAAATDYHLGMRKLLLRLGISAVVLAVLFGGTELYLRRKGFGAGTSVWFDPAIGTRFFPNQQRKIYGPRRVFLSDAHINAQGFRGVDFDAPAMKRDDRIACIGDSFVFGWGVEDGESFPVRLQELLNAGPEPERWQVLNCGMPGYNTWQELRLYERVVRQEDPEIVVVSWYLNDLDPYSIGATGTLTPRSHPLSGTALYDYYVREVKKPKPDFRFVDFDQAEAQRLKEYYDKSWAVFELDAADAGARPYVERNLKHLGLLFDAIRTDGATPVLLVFPTTGQTDALHKLAGASEEERAAGRARITRIQADLAAFAAEQGVPHVDVLDTFLSAQQNPWDDVDLSHPGTHGHELTAKALLETLRQHGLVK
jgi:lysophospholipase L1-like esterase